MVTKEKPKKRMKGVLGEIKPFKINFFPEIAEKSSKRKMSGDLVMIVEDGLGGMIGMPETYNLITHCYLGLLTCLREDKLSGNYDIGISPSLEFIGERLPPDGCRYSVRFNSLGKGTSDLSKLLLPYAVFISKLYAKAPDIMQRFFGVKRVGGLMLPNNRLVKYGTK